MDRITQALTRLAIQSEGVANGRVRMAAGIIYKKQILATGVNQMKTHPLMMEENGYRPGQIFLHAEVDAIRNALRFISVEQLEQTELRVIRVKRPHIGSKKWIHGLAKPCPGCSQVIANFGINNVKWTTDADVLDGCKVDLYESRPYNIRTLRD
jgi:deoxycytidylate deaminase